MIQFDQYFSVLWLKLKIVETGEHFHRLCMDFRALAFLLGCFARLFSLQHVAAERCQITSRTPLNKACHYKEGDTFRPEWFLFNILLDTFEALLLRKGSVLPNTLEAHVDMEAFDLRHKAKIEKCGPGYVNCPPPASAHGIGRFDIKTGIPERPGDDAGLAILKCSKALDSDDFPNACSGSFNWTLQWHLLSDPGSYPEKFAHNDLMYFGIGLYAFTTYDAEAGATGPTRPVLQVRFSTGEVDGICGAEYEVNATDSCFGLKGKDVPVADPPEPPSLSDLVKPPLPALHATPVPGMGAGAVIAIVLLILVVLGGLGAAAVYMKRKKEEEERALRTTQEVELN